MADMFDALIGDQPVDATALANALRQKQALGTVAALTGISGLQKLGPQMINEAASGAQDYATLRDRTANQGLQRALQLQNQQGENARAAASLEESNRHNKEMEQAAKDARDLRLQIATQSRGPKLGVNERVGDNGNVEFIPNTPQYVKAAQAHAKDYNTLSGANQSADLGRTKIDQILDPKNSEGFKDNFGGYTALLTNKLPGALNAKANIESLKSNMKQYGLQLMRSGGSIGQMTEREWPIVEQALATITPTLSEDEARAKLLEVRSLMDSFKQRAKEVYDSAWQDSQFYAPPESRVPAKEGPDNAPAVPAAGGYSDAAKEARYQAWKAAHPNG